MASRLVGKNGIVYSFEPQEEIYNLLKKRIKKRNIKNVIPIHCALYSHKLTMSVEKETSSADFSIVDIKNGKLSNPVTINLIDLDSFVKEFKITRLNFIKMDVEGAEIEALKGAKNVLKYFSPNIAIASYHMREGAQTAKWLEHFLNEQGYKTWTGFPLHLTTYGYK
jgi:FkbM family methyltransferase